jgi:glycosyltransferase involved in cell wall biosynthesis
VQAVVVNMVKGLSEFRNLEIHILTTSPRAEKDTTIVSNGVSVHVMPSDRHLGNIRFYPKARNRIRRKIDELKPDVIHGHIFGYYGLGALDSGHKKVIVSTHGMPAGLSAGCGMKEAVRTCSKYIMHLKCANAAREVIVNSPYAKKMLNRFKNMNIRELDNPVSDDFFRTDGLGEEEGRILFAGNICRPKGIMTLLRSLVLVKRSRPGAKLMLAGPITDKGFYSRVIRFIKENNLIQCVNFLGQLDDKRLVEEYRKASIFAFPTNEDVAPLALLQAMAAGKAIVTTRVGGIPYIIKDTENGLLINKGDHRGLADRLTLLMKDRLLNKNLALNARCTALSNNRISDVAGRLYKIYEEVINER